MGTDVTADAARDPMQRVREKISVKARARLLGDQLVGLVEGYVNAEDAQRSRAEQAEDALRSAAAVIEFALGKLKSDDIAQVAGLVDRVRAAVKDIAS